MPPTASGFTAQDAYTPDRLFAGEQPRVSRKVTIIAGENVVRGAVLGLITASGKYNLSLSAAVDGSQTPEAILAEDVDATAADKEGLVYLTGEFNEAALTLGAAHTVASIRQGFRDKGVFLAKTQAAAA